MTSGGGGPAGVGEPDQRAELVETLVRLADTLVDDYDTVDLLDRLVRACVQFLPISAAGILLRDQRGGLSVVASSSEPTHTLEVFQLQSDEGPCLDCVRHRRLVTSDDLARDAARWPAFVPRALSLGFRAVTALPLTRREDTIGGLNLFDARPQPMAEPDYRVARALADVATVAVVQRRALARSTELAAQLQHALDSRVVIEQAKGMLAARRGVSMDAAFAALREFARNNNRKLADVACDVVSGHLVVHPDSTR
jgi:GAF domain-containing protein